MLENVFLGSMHVELNASMNFYGILFEREFEERKVLSS